MKCNKTLKNNGFQIIESIKNNTIAILACVITYFKQAR